MSFYCSILELFLATDRAEAIEGDLIEEGAAKGRIWFHLNMYRTIFVYLYSKILNIQLKTVVLSVCISAVYFAIVLSFFDVTTNYESSVNRHVSILFVQGVTSFIVGYLLLKIAPGSGRLVISGYVLIVTMVSIYLQVSYWSCIIAYDISELSPLLLYLKGIYVVIVYSMGVLLSSLLPFMVGCMHGIRRVRGCVY